MTDACTCDVAALVVYAPSPNRLSQLAAMTTYAYAARAAVDSDLAAFAPYTSQARATDVSDLAALVVYAANPSNVPVVSNAPALVVWAELASGEEVRTRAWTFVMDGHKFYVLDLGEEGTYCYDLTTGQWCQFRTRGYAGWNMRAGTMWQAANRIVAGDLLSGIVWEMSPGDVTDEDFRTIEHIVTGGVMMRSRVFLAVEAVRIAGSIGAIQDDVDGITTTMRFSDDGGNTWSQPYVVVIGQGDFSGEIAYRSLGSFMAPGRVIEFSDEGGMFRIDGADIFIENFDDEGPEQ